MTLSLACQAFILHSKVNLRIWALSEPYLKNYKWKGENQKNHEPKSFQETIGWLKNYFCTGRLKILSFSGENQLFKNFGHPVKFFCWLKFGINGLIYFRLGIWACICTQKIVFMLSFFNISNFMVKKSNFKPLGHPGTLLYWPKTNAVLNIYIKSSQKSVGEQLASTFIF